MRFLLLIPLVACASLPDILPCDPTVSAIDPEFVNLGNNDQMVASIRWYGCPDTYFGLCGVNTDWFREDRIKLAVWYDDEEEVCGNDEQIDDRTFNLYSLRDRYEKEYDVDAATLTLEVGSHDVVYSFVEDE